jgi:hypothetical protein
MERIAIDAAGAELSEVGAQVPRASELAAGTCVVVFASARRGWLSKMLARDAAPLHVLCSALLARGYTEIAGGQQDGRVCAWGVAPDSRTAGPRAP